MTNCVLKLRHLPSIARVVITRIAVYNRKLNKKYRTVTRKPTDNDALADGTPSHARPYPNFNPNVLKGGAKPGSGQGGKPEGVPVRGEGPGML